MFCHIFLSLPQEIRMGNGYSKCGRIYVQVLRRLAITTYPAFVRCSRYCKAWRRQIGQVILARLLIAETARMHEQAGFDRVLIGYFSHAPDGFLIGAHAAAVTRRLQFLLAHRPGFVAPTVAARKLATLDHLSGGRTAVHLITGGSDAEQARDGDFTDHDARYRRTQEYATLLQRTWTAPAPFDHEGEFYRVVGAYADIRCQQVPHMPIYGGGGSPAAMSALAPVVDVYMLWGEPLKATAAFMEEVRAVARQ